MTICPPIDWSRRHQLLGRERARYAETHPGRALLDQAEHLFGRVPMIRMARWSPASPWHHRRAENTGVDVTCQGLVVGAGNRVAEER